MHKKFIFGLTLTAALAATTAFGSLSVATADSYVTSDLFIATGANLTSVSDNGEYLAAEFKDGDKIEYKQSLALEWMESKESCAFFHVEFSFADFSFDAFTMTLETDEESITKEKKATNTLTFTSDSVQVNDQTPVAFSDRNVSVSLARGGQVGEYAVLVNGVNVGEFTNVGKRYSEYRSSSAATPCVPLTFSAEGEGTVVLREMNGQSFALTDGKVVDDTAPVLVVNEEVRSFILGYTVSIDYMAIDVCDEVVTKSVMYTQYGKEEEKLTSTTVLFETEQYKQSGCEYVAFVASLKDDSGNEANCDFSWYSDGTYLTTFEDRSYFSVTRNNVGANYVGTQEQYDAYQAELEKAAEGVSVGNSSYVYYPSLRGLIEDDDTAYENFSFTIYYKTQGGSNVITSSTMKSSTLALAASSAGRYAVKIVVTDKMGNGMYADLDGKTVKVTSSNVFDIEEIPEFHYTIYNYGVSVENVKTVKTGYVDASITATAFTINAVSGYEAKYSLFYFDNVAYYSANGTYLTNKELLEDPEKYSDYLTEIDEYNSEITEDDEAWSATDNDYQWNSSSRSFVPQKTGYYLVKAEVTDAELYGIKDTAYQVMEITSALDVVAGDSDFVQNNIVSISLFCVAGVLFIGVILLIVIDPKEKDLDEIDA
ncbi:MAG: hypothetical protein J5993_03415 [Clostridia bacterium]|nr:hypothetical protein [Clostridia bacterium]